MHSRDKIEQHLIQQKARSVKTIDSSDTRCQYRGENGLMCAVGCLIAEEHYRPAMESIGVAHLQYQLDPRLPEDISVKELARWQQYHDGSTYTNFNGPMFCYQAWIDGDESQHPTLFKQHLLEQGAYV